MCFFFNILLSDVPCCNVTVLQTVKKYIERIFSYSLVNIVNENFSNLFTTWIFPIYALIQREVESASVSLELEIISTSKTAKTSHANVYLVKLWFPLTCSCPWLKLLWGDYVNNTCQALRLWKTTISFRQWIWLQCTQRYLMVRFFKKSQKLLPYHLIEISLLKLLEHIKILKN